jgi:WD40 repeat protein
MDVLPDELRLRILKFVPGPDLLLKICRLNKSWHRLVFTNYLWKHICSRYSYNHVRRLIKQKGNEIDWLKEFRFLSRLESNWIKGSTTKQPLCYFETYVRGLQFDERILVAGLFDGRIALCPLDSVNSDPGGYNDIIKPGFIYAHQGKEIRCLKFRKNILITSAWYDSNIKIWNLDTTQKLHGLPSGHHEGLSCCDLDFDGKLVVAASERTIKLWDLRSLANPIHSISYRQKVQSVQILDDNSTILVATDDDDYDFYRTTSAWSLTAAKQIQTFDTTFSATCIRSFGDKMVVGAMDSSLELYNLHNGERIRKFSSSNNILYAHPVIALQFDEKKLISAAREGCIRVWDITTGKLLYVIKGFTAYQCSLQYDDYKLICDGTNNAIYRWNFTPFRE